MVGDPVYFLEGVLSGNKLVQSVSESFPEVFQLPGLKLGFSQTEGLSWAGPFASDIVTESVSGLDHEGFCVWHGSP